MFKTYYTMKKILLSSIMLLVFVVTGSAQCNAYFGLHKNSKWEVTSYNAKDKMTGKQVNEVKDFKESGNGWEAMLAFQSIDKKGKTVLENEADVRCSGGVVSMDLSRLIPQESLNVFKNMSMDISVENMEFPSNLKIGMTLNEGSMKLSSSELPISMTIKIKDRKVEKKEKITTPTGTYDCFKITYKITIKTIINTEMSGAEWIAEGVGVVKSESYNRSGKKMGYSLLTDIQ